MLSQFYRVRPLIARCVHWSADARRRTLSSKTQHDPLRILFCGADNFSIESLKALNTVRVEDPEKVASIDVVCRKDKRFGRGLKQIREVPIKNVARSELGLNVHQIDTFTGWSPPLQQEQPFNMVVAVSFGLLVPPRILNAAKYGGLNVHPSMLPDLRGPAPLHHTLLRRLQKTGVTLQTLHPTRFDEGLVVDQTPDPGLPVPDVEAATVESLLDWIGPLGAQMLYENIMAGSFVSPPPVESPELYAAQCAEQEDLFGHLNGSYQYPRHAGKITPQDRHLDFSWPVNEIVLRDRTLGRLFVDSAQPLSPKRTTFHEFQDTTQEFEAAILHEAPQTYGQEQLYIFKHDSSKRLFFKAKDGFVSPQEITIEGKAKQKASIFHQQLIIP